MKLISSPNSEHRLVVTLSALAFCFLLTSCSSSSDGEQNPVLADPVVPDPVVSPIPSESLFDDGTADSWTITGSSSTVPTVPTNGICGLVQVDPGPGFLCADATSDGGTSYFVAPEKFTGDLNVFSSLNFSLVINGGTYFDSGFGFDGDISISNGVSRAFFIFTEDQQPTDVWETYQIPLNDEGVWVVDDGSALSTVLQSVTELRIRAEYGIGSDNAGLDDVSLE